MITYEVAVTNNGSIFWYNEKNQLHREDGPAIEYSHGEKVWYRNGKLHREDGPAIENINGYKSWYQNGKFHREDGPAVEYADGSKAWYLNGQCHRLDGPAVEGASEYKFWYLNGIEMTEEEHTRATSLVKEMSVAEIEKLLGYRVKIIKD